MKKTSQIQFLELANERLRSHELQSEAIAWIHDVLEPEEVPYELLVGIAGSAHRDGRSVITEELIQASDFETVVLTNERIVFFHDEQQHEIPLAQLRSINVGDGMSLARISFYTHESQRSLQQVNVEDAQRFAEVARDQLQLPVRIGTAVDISDSRAQHELTSINGLRRAGLISEAEWADLRRPILARLGLEETPVAPAVTEAPKTSHTVRNASLIILLSIVAMIAGALLMNWSSADEPETTAQPMVVNEPEEPSEAATPTATETPAGEITAPADSRGVDEEDAPVATPEETPTPEPSEEPSASASPSPSPTDGETSEEPASPQLEFETLVSRFLSDRNLNTSASVEYSEERVTVAVQPYAGNTESSAIDVSAELAILVAEDNSIIESPAHDTRVTVPVDGGGVVAVNFDRADGRYTQVRE